MGTYGRICYLALLDGNIEVDTNENAFPSEREVSNGELVREGHDGRR